MDIHECCRNGNLAELQHLITNGANISMCVSNEKDNYGRTPLHIVLMSASDNVFDDLALTLIENGANINEKDNNGWTPFHIATNRDHPQPLIELIKKGADINEKTGKWTTPLLYPRIKVDEFDGWTPLHLATHLGALNSLIILIENGANVNERNNDGWTPLHIASYAKYCRCPYMVEVLLNYSDPSIKTNDGKTALDLAKDEEIKRLIIDYQIIDVKEPEYC